MILVRLVAAVLAAIAATAAVAGFAVTDSLAGSGQFVAAMEEALTDPAVQQELQTVIRQEVTSAGERLAGSVGPLGDLARSGADSAASRLSQTVTSPEFASAWSQWSELLYQGLTDAAVGTPNDQVSVAGNQVTVAIAPLVEPILGASLSGGLTGALDLFGQDTSIVINTAVPVQQALDAAGAFSQWRWLFVAAAFVLALVAVFGGSRRMRWLGITLVFAALCAGAVSVALMVGQATPPPGSQTPELAMAITAAIVEPWATALRTAAVAAAAVGFAALIIALFLTPRSQ